MKGIILVGDTGSRRLVRPFANTFALKRLTTQYSKNYAPHQFLEQVISPVITCALGDQMLSKVDLGSVVGIYGYLGARTDECSRPRRVRRVGAGL
jgi:dTDP-D-glucose 4,6-dehydratase